MSIALDEKEPAEQERYVSQYYGACQSVRRRNLYRCWSLRISTRRLSLRDKQGLNPPKFHPQHPCSRLYSTNDGTPEALGDVAPDDLELSKEWNHRDFAVSFPLLTSE